MSVTMHAGQNPDGYFALKDLLPVTPVFWVRQLVNVSCPRGRTFVSSGVHPMLYGVANHLDCELPCLVQFG